MESHSCKVKQEVYELQKSTINARGQKERNMFHTFIVKSMTFAQELPEQMFINLGLNLEHFPVLLLNYICWCVEITPYFLI